MPISVLTTYAWTCAGCGQRVDAPIWSILDGQERPELIQGDLQHLLEVVCPLCQTTAPITAPLLLVRAKPEVGLLLALPDPPISEEELAAARRLAERVGERLGQDASSLGPLLDMPRSLLPIVLGRDLTVDAQDPDTAVSGLPEVTADHYRRFLQVLREVVADHRTAGALGQLMGVMSMEQLRELLHSYPELRGERARGLAEWWLQQGLPPGESSDTPMRALVQFVRRLADGEDEQGLAEYQTTIGSFWSTEIQPNLEELWDSLDRDDEGLIDRLREAAAKTNAAGLVEHECRVLIHLGTVLVERRDASHAERIEEAIGALQRALELCAGEPDPTLEGRALAHLGIAYWQRPRRDRGENLERARAYIEQALGIFTREQHPEEWALNHTNLALVYLDWQVGEREENVEAALRHCQLALEVRSFDRNPVDWAYTQLTLGMVYLQRTIRDRPDNLKRARFCFEQALRGFTREGSPLQWAQLQHNIADIHLRRETGNRSGEVAEAIRHLELALEERTRDTAPLDWARSTDLLAQALLERDGPGDAERASTGLNDALEILTPTNAPQECRDVAYRLGRFWSERRDWPRAAVAYLTGIDAEEVLYQSRSSAKARSQELYEVPQLSRWTAYALARAGSLDQAVEVLENWRAREVGALLARDEADLTRLRELDQPTFEQFSSARAELQQAEVRPADPTQPAVDAAAFERAARHFGEVVEAVRELPGMERFLLGPSITEIAGIAAGGPPLAYLLPTPDGSISLLVAPAAGQQDSSSVQLVEGANLTSKDVIELLLFRMDRRRPAPGFLLAQGGADTKFEIALDKAIRALGRGLLRPLTQVLRRQGFSSVVLIPCGPVGLLSLHAASWQEAGRVIYVSDELLVSSAPSAVAYRAARERAQRLAHRPLVLVGVGNPKSSGPDLPAAEAELTAIHRIFSNSEAELHLRVGPDATKGFLMQHLPAATHLHLACHGYSDFADPLESALYLAERERLTLREVMDSVRVDARLVVLSACQSGQFDILRAPDEVTGLPAGFLRAGSAAVVATLWPVDDEATALLIARFYEVLQERERSDGAGTPGIPAAALRDAQHWLRTLSRSDRDVYLANRPELQGALRRVRRDRTRRLYWIGPRMRRTWRRWSSQTPYEHPVDWAAFHLVGV
jgi:CHAT domain-containing protein/tetratricopeptide (TPR) repeat protein